ncbi:11555_t:CDS:1, partial [Funneliformis geosporum]
MDSNIDKFLYDSTACVYDCNKLRECVALNYIVRNPKNKETYEAEKLNTEILIS